MKLSEIIKSNNWLSVKMTLLEHFPDVKENLENYEFVFEKLNFLPPKENMYSISLSLEEDDDGAEYTLAYKEIPLTETSSNVHSLFFPLYFTPWREWLGMEIEQGTYENYSELEIIVHCLMNMTCFSFDEEEILAKEQKFAKQWNKYAAMTREELLKHIEIVDYPDSKGLKDKEPDIE